MSKQYDKICFYNWYGNGDLFTAREFIKDCMTFLPTNKFTCAHGKSERMFNDIVGLEKEPIQDFMSNAVPFVEKDGSLYINTWIGRDSKYVLPGVGCVVTNYLRMWNDILEAADLPKLQHGIDKYIPKIDYSYFEIDGINEWLNEHIGRRKVLISNGPVHSNQAENFDFDVVLELLCSNYPDYAFIRTQPSALQMPNLYNTWEFVKTSDGFDLNEISYLSLFTDTIVGRASGPYVFTQVRENYFDPTKALVGFCHSPNTLDFVGMVDLPIRMQRFWSPSTHLGGIATIIVNVLNRID